jgi:hypothetical protein
MKCDLICKPLQLGIVGDTGSMASMTDESKVAIAEFERNITEVNKHFDGNSIKFNHYGG